MKTFLLAVFVLLQALLVFIGKKIHEFHVSILVGFLPRESANYSNNEKILEKKHVFSRETFITKMNRVG